MMIWPLFLKANSELLPHIQNILSTLPIIIDLSIIANLHGLHAAKVHTKVQKGQIGGSKTQKFGSWALPLRTSTIVYLSYTMSLSFLPSFTTDINLPWGILVSPWPWCWHHPYRYLTLVCKALAAWQLTMSPFLLVFSCLSSTARDCWHLGNRTKRWRRS